MRGINNTRTLRHLIQLVDEDRSFLRQITHHIAVVHDLLAHINRRAKGIQRNLHDIDRAHNTRAEAARLQKKNATGRHRNSDVFMEGLIEGMGDGSHPVSITLP